MEQHCLSFQWLNRRLTGKHYRAETFTGRWCGHHHLTVERAYLCGQEKLSVPFTVFPYIGEEKQCEYTPRELLELRQVWGQSLSVARTKEEGRRLLAERRYHRR